MADEKTIRIGAEDDTGRAISSAAGNFNKLHSGLQKQFKQTESGGIISMKAVEQMAKRTGQSVQDTLKKVTELTEATRRQAQFHQQAGREAQRTAEITRQAHRDAIAQQSQLTAARRLQMANVVTTPRGGWPPGGGPGGGGGGPPPPPGGGGGALAGGAAGALMKTAGRYIGIGAALETARRGFMGYAQFDTKLRLTQNQTKMTAEEIKGLGEEMKQLSKITGESADDMLDTFNEVREAGNFTPEEARKMLPDITSAAIGVGANAKIFARAMGDIMRNLKIPAAQYGSVMEAMSHANERYNISIEEMGPSLSRATAYMAAWGYQGEEAAQRGIVMMGLLKEATGSASKAGAALTGILGDLGSDAMGDALGFAPGKLEEELKRSTDPIGRLFFLMSKADNQDLVMKAIGIQDKAAYAKLMDNLKNFNGYLKDVKESKDAVAKGKFIEEGPERAAMRMVNALKEMTNSLGILLDALGATHALNWFAKTMADAAVGVERVIAGVKALITLDFSGMMGWEEFKYRLTAARDENDKLIMSFKEYKMIKDQRGEAAADVAYNLAVKKYEDAKKKIADDRTKAKEKREEVSDEAWRKEMKAKYPDLDIDQVPRPKKTAPTTTVPVPRAMPSIDDTGAVHAPATPAPATPAPMQQFKIPTPEERNRILQENQKLGAVVEDTTAKLVSFGDALEARPGYGVGGARPIGYRPGGAGAPGPTSAQGAATGAGTIAATPIAYRPGEAGKPGGGYGGSGDARVMQASYTPSGRIYSGPPGGPPSSGLAGPGGSGSAYGGGTTLAPPSGGNYPNVPQQAPQAPTVPGRNRASLPPPTAPTNPNAPVAPGEQTGGGLEADRAKFKAELDANPALREKVLRIAANEQGKHGLGTQAVLESMMNRASSRGRTLAQEARWAGTGPGGEGGYYERGNLGRGALENPEHKKVLEDSLAKTLAGGNVSDYATDNASQALAAKRKANQEMVPTVDLGGESFFRPGRVSGEGNVRSHAAWMARMRGQPGTPRTQTASATPGDTTTTPSNIVPPGTEGQGPTPGQDPSKIPYHQQGTIEMEGKIYRYGSGGTARGATPAGSYNINIAKQYGGQGQLGDWGAGDDPHLPGQQARSIATVGGLGGTYKDPRYNEARAGVQIHSAAAGRLDKLYSAGCFAIAPDQWPAYRDHLLDMHKRTPGGLRIDVGKDGRAQIVARGTKVATPGPVPGSPADKVGQATTPPPAPPTTGSEASTRGEDQTPIGKAFREQSIRQAKDKAEGFPAPGEPGSYENPKTGDSGFVNTKDPSVEQPGVPYDRDQRREEHRKMRPDTDSVDRDVQTNVNLKVNDNQVQFARSSMRRQADREVREARWNSYSDIGAA